MENIMIGIRERKKKSLFEWVEVESIACSFDANEYLSIYKKKKKQRKKLLIIVVVFLNAFFILLLRLRVFRYCHAIH
jgi:uncharacterized membrane protein